MKFKVSKKVKGSLILKSLGRPVKAGTVVYVEGNRLYADDIKRAVKAGLLIDDEPDIKNQVKENIMDKTDEVVIINKRDRVVIIGDFPIRPNGSSIRKIDTLDMGVIRKSIETGLIQVITDVNAGIFENEDDSEPEVAEVPVEENPEEKITEKIKDSIYILEETSIEEKKEIPKTELSPEEELAQIMEEAEAGDSGEEEPVEEESNSFIWDFRTQKKKKPQVIPKAGQKLIDFDTDDDIEMIDALDEVNEIEEATEDVITNKIENIKKQVSQVKTSKKKDQSHVKLKINKEEEEAVAQALDSMGRPLQNDMTHMVGDFDSEEISFADKEQAQKSIDMSKKRDSGINIDLD